MQLNPGERLGPYEIAGPVGAGGMGEVCKARDTRLERSVAVRILPSEFAGNAQLRLRFDRDSRFAVIGVATLVTNFNTTLK